VEKSLVSSDDPRSLISLSSRCRILKGGGPPGSKKGIERLILTIAETGYGRLDSRVAEAGVESAILVIVEVRIKLTAKLI
jgi:hypothetical protein